LKRPLKRRSQCLSRWISLLAGASLGQLAHAQSVPTGGVVTAGQAAIENTSDRSLAIRQQSDRSVIRWNDFSIAEGARVDFLQPNRNAATLNIVQGSDISTLAGILSANGSVYLVNPNGIAITPTGLIDTRGGFVGSTLPISEEDFMSERLLFSGRGGSITNHGRIRTDAGGVVALLGSRVENAGYISAPLGKVALGAGERMALDLNGDGFLQLLLPTELAQGALIGHSGSIDAPGGTVMLKADTVRQAWRDIVHVPGEIHANSVQARDGRIVFSSGSGNVHVSGTLDVSAAQGAERGGSIDITGANVSLNGAMLDATGPSEGGRIRIGGAFQGGKPGSTDSTHAARFGAIEGSPALAASTTTSVDAASVIDVSATGDDGRGGSVVLWSDTNTRMDGTLRATGAASGGAVEISSAEQVQSLALDRLELSRDGLLLIDPKNIWITVGGLEPYSWLYEPDHDTVLDSDQLVGLLSSGVDISLVASNDLSWFASDVPLVQVSRPAPNMPAGNLDLIAGRSVTLEGVFETGGGTWNIVANAPAALGVIDAYRDEGAAEINVSWAEFINDTGPLSFTLADGAGNTHRFVDGISLGAIASSQLTVNISPTALNEWWVPWITVTQDLRASGDLTLTGNLSISGFDVSIRGNRVTWTDELTAGLRGEGLLRFYENNVLTRYGRVVGSDIVRMELGGGSFTRVYGDSASTSVQTAPAIRVSEHSPVESPDDLSTLLKPGSLTVTGDPGAMASVGNYTVTVAATDDFEIDWENATSGYFFNLSPATTSLAITPRKITATVSNGAYTYGSPTSVVTLNNVMNGDAIAPVATLDGNANITLQSLTGGFGFGPRVAAGSHSFTVTGITGAAASNYVFNATGSLTGSLTISPRSITYGVGNGSQVYGTLGNLPSVGFTGVLADDVVFGQIGLRQAGSPVGHDARLRVGSYEAIVTSLTGPDAGNYVLATNGHTSGVFTVTPKPLNWSVGSSSSIYGTLATSFGASLLDGVLPNDQVFGVVTSVTTLTDRTPVGSYATAVTALTGADAANYTLASSGNQHGTHVIQPKPLNWTFTDVTSTYGEQHGFGFATLHGALPGDSVWVTGQAAFRDGKQVELNERTPAGQYEQRVTAVSNPNYTLADSGNQGTITINPRSLLYQLPSYTYTYGDTPSSLPYVATFANLMPWDVNRVFPGEIAIESGDALGAKLPVGSYRLTMKSLQDSSGNYVLGAALNVGTLTVTPRPLTWSLGQSTSVYGAESFNLPSVTFDTLWSEHLTGELTYQIEISDAQGRAFTTRSLPGQYVARVVSIGGSAAGNYVLQSTGTPGVHTHVPRPVYVDLPSLTVTYGDSFTLPSATLSGVLPGDYVSLGPTVVANGLDPRARLDVGTYSMQVSSLLGIDAAKYQIQGGFSQLRIEPRVLTVNDLILPRWNGRAIPTSAVYGSMLKASDPQFGTGRWLRLSFKDELSGGNPLSGDDLRTILIEPVIGVSSGGAYVVGQYQWRLNGLLEGADAYNYVFDFDSSQSLITLNITPRPIELWTGVQDRDGKSASLIVYGEGSNYDLFSRFWESDWLRAAGRTVLPGDDVKPSDARLATPSGARDHVPERLNVGTYQTSLAGGLSGSDASNYVVDVVYNDSVQIVQRPVTVQVADRSWEYGPARSFNITNLTTMYGLLPGDEVVPYFDFNGQSTLSLTDSVSFGAKTSVGSFYLQPIGITGADASNYRFIPVGVETSLLPSRQGTFSIQPRPVIYRAPFGARTFTYGDIVEVTPLLEGVLDDDDVSLSLYARDLRYDSLITLSRRPLLDAGDYALAGLLSGASAGNYVLRGPNGQQANALAHFTINPRTLKIESVSMRSKFGQIGAPEVISSGLLPGHQLDLSFTYWDSYGIEVSNGGWLSAGTYSLRASVDGIVGSSLSNYRLDPSSRLVGTWTIDPLTIDLGLSSQSVIYGESLFLTELGGAYSYRYYDRATRRYVEVLLERPELELTANVDRNFRVTTSSASRRDPVTYSVDPTVGVGTYTVSFELKYTPLRDSLRLVNNTATIQILPRTLTLELPAEHSTVYGGHFGTLTGVVNDDDVGITLDFLRNDTNATTTSILRADSTGTLLLTNREEVGDYVWSTSGLLGGSKARNYVLDIVGATNGTLSLTPRELHWQVDQQRVQYRNFAACESGGCYPWNRGSYGKVNFDALVPGDVLGGPGLQVVMSLIDFDGNFLDLNSKTPLGTYFQVVTGLTGSKAHNYTLADYDNLPGILEVVPAWLNYKVDSGVYVGGLGLYGSSAGTVHWYQNSTSPVYPNVVPIVEAWYNGNPDDKLDSEGSNLKVGEYHFRIVGLAGPDAANYRLVDGSLTHTAARPTEGKLFVFADTSFGLEFVGQGELPPPPKVTTNANAYAGTSVGYTGVGAGAGAGASATAHFGDVDLTASARATSEALAKVGAGNIKVQARADGRVEVRVESGPGTAYAGAGASAEGGLELSRTGLTIGGEAKAGLDGGGGASGSLGAVGDGSIDANIGVFAYARSETKYGYKDGKITAGFDQAVGVGTSVGFNTGLSGSVGSIGGGATLYSPGSLAAKFDIGGGLEGDQLQVSINLGLAIGIGGLGLDFDFSVDVGWVNDALCFVGVCSSPSPPPPPTPDQVLMQRLSNLIETQNKVQAKLLNLLSTDPQAAAAYLNSSEYRNARDELGRILWQADHEGYKLINDGGSLKFVRL